MSEPRQKETSQTIGEICALTYEPDGAPPDAEHLIWVVVRTDVHLQIFVSAFFTPENMGNDWQYLAELLDEVAHRAEDGPATVFEQLKSLSVGPVVTYSVCPFDPQTDKISSRFPGLKPYSVNRLHEP